MFSMFQFQMEPEKVFNRREEKGVHLLITIRMKTENGAIFWNPFWNQFYIKIILFIFTKLTVIFSTESILILILIQLNQSNMIAINDPDLIKKSKKSQFKIKKSFIFH